jgi:hypothetical protein
MAISDFNHGPAGVTLDPAALELEQWHRFVHLLLLLVQSGRLDPVDGIALVEALGHPPDVARGRRALFEIVRRHEPDAAGDGSQRTA